MKIIYYNLSNNVFVNTDIIWSNNNLILIE